MTAALYDEVVTVAPAGKLTVVRDVTPTQASEGISHGCESAETKKSSSFTFSLHIFADVAIGCGAHC
jgi:hypothetical protein